ncbi:uncharacterized protein DSM5745_02923 [Aspergillus mulundensis]|uniref:Uncharacterized protein n=1 Tax=Aspergillus mulundensis TaxID=1810919 RepID=A0A3D8SJD2_9EURO|nr:hypothetical protein DSM5745_02923 [Aspergillus mulundensis]RDW86281.1 hypothetical protein DSM5745_02923 [Aspergillus mulundensis]
MAWTNQYNPSGETTGHNLRSFLGIVEILTVLLEARREMRKPDGSNGQTISTGRALLVEATAATWLVGTRLEHHELYQYNLENAHNVFSTMQQSESVYWQGPGNMLIPAPWQDNVIPSDPDFSQFAADDALCRMGHSERIHASSNFFLYGGCTGRSSTMAALAMQLLENSTTNMLLSGNQAIATEDENAGGWGGVIAAYLYSI